MDVDSLKEFTELTEIEALRKINEDLQNRLRRAKAREEDLVAATIDGAKAAMISLGPILPVKSPKADKRTAKEEIALWHLTDWQGAKVTTSYNSEIMRNRVLSFCDAAQIITEMQRSDHPVKECYILLGGDMIEGLFNYPTQPFEVDATIFGQYTKVSRVLVEVLMKALSIYEKVTVKAKWGNHGRIGAKRSVVPSADNFDRMIYHLARELLLHEKRLVWEDSIQEIQRFEIGNYSATLIHGDEIGRQGYASPMTIVNHVAKWQSGAYPYYFRDCVDSDTEALTPVGWKKYDEIGKNEIATMNPKSGLFEWQLPFHLLTKEYEGDLIHHKGRSMDHLSTPNHDMWVRHHEHDWKKRKASDTPADTNWLYRSSSDGWNNYSFYDDLPDRLIGAKSEDISELVGWYIAEGNATQYHVQIAQSRNKKPIFHERIIKLLELLGYKANSQPYFVRTCNKELAEWLRCNFGHLAPNKHIPNWAKNLPTNDLMRIIDSACCGDGTKTINKNGSVLRGYYTCSDKLSDDIQEVALKLGLSTMKSTREPTGFGKLPSHMISLSESSERRMAKNMAVERYRGIVWCPTVDNGLWFMRRNGRVMVTGNCYLGHYHNHQEWQLPNGTGSVYMTGSPESDNRYALVLMAGAAAPTQRLHFISPSRGHVTSQHKVYLED